MRDLRFLFAGPAASNLSAAIVTIRTREEMNAWSARVLAERETAYAHLIRYASIVCARLRGTAWIDFVDPGSGWLYFSDRRTSVPLLETDPVVPLFDPRHLRLECTGSCRALRHTLFGWRVMCLVILTTASAQTLQHCL